MKTTYYITKIRNVAFAIILFVSKAALAQVSITTLPYTPASTDFNAYNPNSAANALATIPTGWSYNTSGTPAYNGQTILPTTTGGYWGFSTLLFADINLGALRNTSTGNIAYNIDYVNNTGGLITTLVLSWDYEQWCFANSSGWNCSGTGALAGNAILNGKDFTGVNFSLLNAAVITPVPTFTLTGLSIPNGATFGITWVTTDDTGADNGVAIDNFAISANATPSITLANSAIAAANIFQSLNNNVLYRTDVTVDVTPATLNSAAFTMAGTYSAANVSNLKLWYSTNSVFSTATSTLLATKTTTVGPGSKTFSGLAQQFPVGTGYLFITTDLPCATTIGNTINVAAIATSNFTFVTGNKFGSGFTAGGAQTISALTASAISNQSICQGKNTAAVNFTTIPSGLNVSWSNNNTAIGLASSGTGNIASYSSPTVSANQTGLITATVSNGSCIGASTGFSVTVKNNNQSSSVWIGAVSSDWEDANNWTNCVCGAATNATINATSNNPVIASVANVKNITINFSSTLSVQNTQTLNVLGNWINNGSFSSQKSNINFIGSVAQTISGASTTSFYDLTLTNASGLALTSNQEINGSLQLNAGIFNTNNFLTLTANANNAGRIGAINPAADIINNVTIQQYAPGGTTGWALFGSPMASQLTMADWNDNFSITCLNCPNGYYNFPSVYSYNETIAGTYSSTAKYVPITAITDNIVAGKGYWVYLGNGPQSTSAINFDVTGSVAKSSCLSCSGAVTIPLTKTTNNGLLDDGWNLITNPLPSPISWTALRNGNANVENAIYVYNADLNGGLGAHASYVNGVSSDVSGGIGDNIAIGQGFYVHATASTQLTASENIKTNSNPTFLKTTAVVKPIVRLVLDGETGSHDMTAVYFEQGGSFNFQTNFDAYKMVFDPMQPYVATVSDSIICSIKGLPVLNTNMAIPVKAITAASGSFTFSLLKENFPNNVCVSLHDAFTGITTNILTTDYICTLYDTTSTSRFTLSFFTTSLSVTSNVLQANCTTTTGVLTSVGNNSGPWNYQWINSNNVILKTSLNKTTADSLTGLSGGNYTVKINTVGQCDNFSQTFTINTVSLPTADFSADNYTINLSNSGQVNFTNLSVNTQSSVWDFGDSFGSSTSGNPFYNYTTPGIYPVKLIVQSNSMCSDTIVKQITVLNPTNINDQAMNELCLLLYNNVTGNYTVKLNSQFEKLLTVALYDASGKLIRSEDMNNDTQNLLIDTRTLATGMYLLKITSGEKETQLFKIIR